MKIKDLFGKSRKSLNREANRETAKEAFRNGGVTLRSRPLVLYIEATNTCNLKCPMCPITMEIEGYTRDPEFFDLSMLETMKPFLQTAHTCSLSGGGEPLLHPDFLEIVRVVRESGTQVFFNTNGIPLTAEISRKLIKLDVECISFSIDAADPEIYRKIRVKGELEAVMDNLNALNTEKERAGAQRPFVNIQFTLSKLNRSQIVPMAELAVEANVNQLVVEPLTPVFSIDPTYRAFIEKNYVSMEEIHEDLEAARNIADKGGIGFASHYFDMEKERPRVCVQPWLTFGVRVGGDVFACCGTPEIFGNLKESSLEDVWNSKKLMELRKRLKEKDFPGFCHPCIDENRCSHFYEELVI